MKIESLCKSCDRIGQCFYEAPKITVTGYSRYVKRKPRTNGDRIRAMTDEELADSLCKNTSCGHCIASELCWNGHNGFDYWIKQEVQE